MPEPLDGLLSIQYGSAGRAAGVKAVDLFVDSVIFKDRTTGKYYQRYFDGGQEYVVEVTL